MKQNDHKKLFDEAVNIVKAHLEDKGTVKVNKTSIATEIADRIAQNHGFPIAERTLRNYWGDFEKNPNYRIPTGEVLDGLGKLCGREDYADWLRYFKKGVKKGISRKYIVIGVLILFLFVFGLVYWFSKRVPGMVWNLDHYEQKKFDEILYAEGKMDSLNPVILENFRKVNPDSITFFFDEDEKPLIWYGYNSEGKLEFFTYRWYHPETKKELKPISTYMINKYILSKVLEQQDSIP